MKKVKLCNVFEFFTFITKLPEMATLASKDFTAVKKITSSVARPVDPSGILKDMIM